MILKFVYVLFLLAMLTAGYALMDQVMQAFAEPQAQASSSTGATKWFADKVLKYAQPELNSELETEVDPATNRIAVCAQELKAAKENYALKPEQASAAFKQCLEKEL